jgi:hypothetical protein
VAADPDGFQPVETAIKRDRWGRYVIPDPETGKERSWTRATTIAGTLSDRFGLERWAKRNVVLGIGIRSDLYAQAASCKPDDKDALDRIVTQAEEAAASKAKANLGTALHRFTERLDAGDHVDVPDPWRADVEAYAAAMNAHAMRVALGWIERILVVPEIGAAGTCDRLCTSAEWPLPRIGDLKTGADVVKYGMTEIAIQEAIYAHATHWFDPLKGELHEMPTVDQQRAIVMHLPIGQATCTLYEVDIAAGWEAAQLAVAVRAWRQRHDLADQLAGAPIVEPLNAERFEWCRDRVERIKSAGHGGTLALRWSLVPEIPTFKRGGPRTDSELDRIAALCELVEMEHGLGFGPSDPATPPATRANTKRDRTHA